VADKQDERDNQTLETIVQLVKRDSTRRYTLAPFLIPDTADLQGDIVSAEEIFDSITRVKFSKSLLDKEHLHVDEEVGTPVEIYALPDDTLFSKSDKPSKELQEKLDELEALRKSIATDFPDEVTLIPKGSGMLGVVWNEKTWKSIQKGDLTGLSIEGKGKRTPVDAAKE
jgi:hypothetical protein